MGHGRRLPSALWGQGYITDDNGPNCNQLLADDLPTCSDIGNAVGGGASWPRWDGLLERKWPRQAANGPQPAQRGVNTCFADGSVHYISDFVQTGTSSSSLGVWDKLNLSNDHFPIDASSY